MKTVSIRELHARTGKLVREAAQIGEIYITDRGQTIARILPQAPEPAVPYFARRKLSPAFRKLLKSRKLKGGADSTLTISQDREARA